MVGSTLGVYSFALIFVSARTNKRHHHHKLLIFVGGTSGSVNVKTFNDNLQELQVIESKRNAIRKGLAFKLLNAQDAVLCSYFAQRAEARGQVQVGNGIETFQLGNFK
jgi:hypothetical protein